MTRLTPSRKAMLTTALAVSLTITSLFGTYTAQAANSILDSGISTGSTKLSNQYTGKGIKVAVIDSGIDKDHFLFKGKIKKGYDFVEQDLDPQDENDHGTHVAGIIAQQAPNAEFLIYRVFGPTREQAEYTPFVVNAIEQAVADGAQVINLSLNANIDAPGEPVARAVSEAVKKGVVVVTSAGNQGEDWTITSPGYGAEPIVVGATSQHRKDAALVSGNTKVQLHPIYGAKMLPTTGKASFVYAGKVTPEQLKNAKYKGKVVIVELTDEDYEVDSWYTAAQQAGIAGMIFALPYIDEGGSTMYVNVGQDSSKMIPAAIIAMEDANKLKKLQSNNWSWSSVTVGEKIGDLSSHGPAVGTWLLKPDLVAPGMHIYSSKAGENRFGMNSGTSMASPQVAAAAALLLEAHPDWTPEMVKSALMQHANQLVDEKGKPYPRTAQGAGSLNVEAALKANTFAYPASLSFGHVAPGYKGKNPVLSQSLELTNTSSKPVTYKLEVQNETVPGQMKMDIPQQVTVQPNSKALIPVKWTVDTKQKAGVWTGSILIKGNNDTLRVPFVLVNQVKSYPLVKGLYMDNTMYAPKGNKEFMSSVLDYYVTVPSQRVLITATWQEMKSGEYVAGKTYVLLNQPNHAKGLNHYKFTGKDVNGAVLPDGYYSIKVKSFAEQRQTVLDEYGITIDTKSPVITNINKQKADKGQLLGTLNDAVRDHGIVITKELERHRKFEIPLLTMQWRTKDSQQWRYANVNVDEGRFFADMRSAKLPRGKHTIVLRVKDVFGNQAEHTTQVTIK